MTQSSATKLRSLSFAIIAAVIFAAWPSMAWNPLNDIKNGLGSVARGVGSIFGNGLAGFAGPSIDLAADAFQKVADNTITKLDGTAHKILGEVDRAAEARINQVQTLLSLEVADVDTRIQERIKDVDEVLATKIGSADIIATRQIINAESALMNVVQYASVVALITIGLALCLWVLVKRTRYGNSFQNPGPNFAWGVLATAVFSLLSFSASSLFQPPSGSKLSAIEGQLIESYKDAIETGDVDSAVLFASQYSSLEATKLSPRFLVQFADLQRDLLKRSALFTVKSRNPELVSRVSQLSRMWEKLSADLPKQLGFLRYEVPATGAMIAWQTANTFQEQRDAACTAAAALWQYQSNGGIGQPADQPQGTTSSFKFASPYVWLSASYINWMKQTAPDWAEPVAALCSKIEIGIKEENWLRKAQDIALLFTSYEAEAPASIRAVFRYNVASSTFYKSLSTAYTDAVISDVQYRTLSEQGSQERASKERKEAIDRLRSAWTDFTTVLNSAGDLGQRDILMSMAGLPLGIVVRADALLAADRPAAGQPAAARVGYKADQICGKLGAIKDLFAPGAATALCVNQEAVDTKLLAFETLLETAFAASRTPEPKLVQFAREFATKPENVDMLSLVNNLNACIYFDSTQTGMYLPCGKDSKSRPVRLIGWMEQSSEKQNPKPDAVRVSMVR